MSTLVGEVLETWRHAERLLEHLPPTEPARETAEEVAAQLRSVYRSLTEDLHRTTKAEFAAGRDTIARSRAVLETIAHDPTSYDRATAQWSIRAHFVAIAR